MINSPAGMKICYIPSFSETNKELIVGSIVAIVGSAVASRISEGVIVGVMPMDGAISDICGSVMGSLMSGELGKQAVIRTAIMAAMTIILD
jgi:hypothetical protein